jgi:hypothetical protein
MPVVLPPEMDPSIRLIILIISFSDDFAFALLAFRLSKAATALFSFADDADKLLLLLLEGVLVAACPCCVGE